MAGKFTIPEGVPVGAKTVEIKGEHGSTGRAQYVGSATLKLNLQILGSNWYSARIAGFGTVTYVL